MVTDCVNYMCNAKHVLTDLLHTSTVYIVLYLNNNAGIFQCFGKYTNNSLLS